MDTKTTFEVMEKALPLVLELIRDEEIVDFKAQMKGEEKEDITLGAAMEKLLGVFLLKKRQTVIELIATVTGKTVQQVQEQDFSITKVDLKQIAAGDIFDFFAWSLHMATKA